MGQAGSVDEAVSGGDGERVEVPADAETAHERYAYAARARLMNAGAAALRVLRTTDAGSELLSATSPQ